MPVLLHDTEREIPRSYYQRRADEVTVHGVTSSSAARLHLDDNAELVVDCIHLVRDTLGSTLTEENRTTDPLLRMLAALDLVTEALEPWAEEAQDPIA